MSYGFTETISPNGSTSVSSYGLVFVLPCWLLTYANRRRVVYSWAPALVALGAVAVALVEAITGWAPIHRALG
jgi:hypothetical protein